MDSNIHAVETSTATELNSGRRTFTLTVPAAMPGTILGEQLLFRAPTGAQANSAERASDGKQQTGSSISPFDPGFSPENLDRLSRIAKPALSNADLRDFVFDVLVPQASQGAGPHALLREFVKIVKSKRVVGQDPFLDYLSDQISAAELSAKG